MSISPSLRQGGAPAAAEGPVRPREPGAPGVASVGRDRVDRGPPPGACCHELAAPSVLVVFADHVACRWLRPLRRGFRHCFVVVRAESVWLACEPLKDRIELDALALPDDFDLAAFYGEQGHRVLVGQRPPVTARRRFAVAPLTCVTVVKRLLGIDAPWVWTPWQLYAHLCGPEVGFTAWAARQPQSYNSSVLYPHRNSTIDN
jgi:hypothetical protein